MLIGFRDGYRKMCMQALILKQHLLGQTTKIYVYQVKLQGLAVIVKWEIFNQGYI